jgi:cell division protein FtsL
VISAAQAPARAGAPQRKSAPRTQRAPLTVLDRKALAERARRRKARLLLFVSGLTVTGALGVVAAGQALATSQQLRLDRLDAQIAAGVARTQRLEIEKAELAAPSRILAVAEGRLHMVTPSQVTYLSPVTSALGLGLGASSTRAGQGR